jgi:hypothetical protein
MIIWITIFHLLRVGEVMLNRAEALARLGGGFNGAAALPDVNLLESPGRRCRFGFFNRSLNLLEERGRELFSEALRRTDLIRFGNWGNDLVGKSSASKILIIAS